MLYRKTLYGFVCLLLALNLMSSLSPPAVSSAAPPPLPGPDHPLIYDDFAGGGYFKQDWMNWWNQDGGTGSFSRDTVDGRSVGVFGQTPASSSSWAKFEPWHVTVDLSGYKYLVYTMKNPGYPDALIRLVINDGARSYNLTGGWIPVSDEWTDYRYDLDSLVPKINKKKVKFEIWLRQSGGSYGEILIDDIRAETDAGGTAPTLTAAYVTSNTDGVPTQNSIFTFRATYTDQDNEKPFAVQVVIDDVPYEMREADSGDTQYTDGKDYIYITKLPAGSHSYYFRTTDTTSDEVSTPVQSGLHVVYSAQVVDVVVSQAGYSANAYKTAKVIAEQPLVDTTYQVLDGSTVVSSGNMAYEGMVWGKHVYSIDFTSVQDAGSDYTVKSNGISSYPFAILPNLWDHYKDEMTAFYRLQRAGAATEDAYPQGYSSVAPSEKLYHPAGHLDDAQSSDGSQHYDLTGSWYDAGDYGKYGGNQWVAAQIALAYIRHADAPSVKFDNDNNGIPDLIDEAVFGSEYLVKFANQLGGAMYNIRNNASFIHPHKATDNIPGNADDRKLTDYGVGGSAKAAGSLAATARAIYTAIAQGDIDSSKTAELTAFAQQCEEAAEIFYDYVLAHETDPIGSYSTMGGISNSMLLADVQLYLLTNDSQYRNAASAKINALSFEDLYTTNYWDMRPMSMAEFYPHADASTQAHIQQLLKEQADYFISHADDTPYHVFNQFSNFGVNEPHASYLGDLMRYYELFGDPAALRAVQKGIYWIFGVNPWNISWVSGIGSDYVDFLHTRYDEEANTSYGTGIVLPGAMVSGPNMKDPKDRKSESPWYMDRSLHQDDTNQWRYNEFSISIQAGLLYTILSLSALDDADSSGGSTPVPLPILSPTIGDYVRGEVTLFTASAPGIQQVEYKSGSGYLPMSASGGVHQITIDESQTAPFTNRRALVRGTDGAGNHTYSSTHYTIAAPLPDPSTPLLYDDFARNGWWGASGGNDQWVNWYTQNGGTATFANVEEDGRKIGKFTQTPSSASSYAKFQPWHDVVDLSGYRYLHFMMKNPGYPDLRVRIELSDGNKTYNLTGGWASVPASWTDFAFDLDALTPAVNKSAAKLSIWLSQASGSYGELWIDDIQAKNAPSGTPPTLTGGVVNAVYGDTDDDFTFLVNYTDADNELPFAVEVVIDGVVHVMEAVDPGDTDVTDGKWFTHTTRLSPGVHSYYFHTTDTTSDAVTTSVSSGPAVSPAGTTILLYEDFSDGAADGWTPTSGTWSVQDGMYGGKAGSLNSYSVAGSDTWTDYVYEVKVSVTNNTNGNKDAGLVFRYTDENNHYVLYLKNNDRSGRKMELVKVENGVKTTLDYANPSIAADTFYTYKIVAAGDEIEVYKDGVLELSATDGTFRSGKIGARVYANTLAYYDDIMVTM